MYNKIILMGRPTSDPKISVSDESGKKVASYNLAVNRNKSDEADFFRCVGFGHNAEFIEQNIKKGMKILVEGTARIEKYTNAEGVTVSSLNVIVSEHRFCESKKNRQETSSAAAQDEFAPADENVFTGE